MLLQASWDTLPVDCPPAHGPWVPVAQQVLSSPAASENQLLMCLLLVFFFNVVAVFNAICGLLPVEGAGLQQLRGSRRGWQG